MMDPHQSRSRFNLHNLPPIIQSPSFARHSVPVGGGIYHGLPPRAPARFSPAPLRYPATHSLYFPPPPPLLKLGHSLPPSHCHQTSPSLATSFLSYQTPSHSHLRHQTPSALSHQTPSALTSHLIGLLQQPPSSTVSPPSPGPLPLTIKDALSPGCSVSSSSSSTGDKDVPVVSEESDFSNNEPSNAAKCKEYRERNKQKRRREEQEYLAEYEKHRKLKAKYERQKRSIKRLKEYYLELLRRGDLTCPRAKKDKREEEINRGKEIKEMETPLVTVKTEIELQVHDIVVKNEF